MTSRAGGARRSTKEAVRLSQQHAASGFAPTILALYAAFLVGFAAQRIYLTPQPLSQDADATLFAEARAMRDVVALATTIGHRQVSTVGLRDATQYLQQRADAIAQYARSHGFVAEAHVKHLSGAANFEFFHTPITNAYRSAPVVYLTIAPQHAQHTRAVLVGAHFDSTIGSPGAADCAACVAVVLEAARALIARNATLHTPVIFALNGAEETFMQGAHGMMQDEEWASKFGAFINVESTGSSGPPIAFQHTSQWVIDAYAAAASIPRGSSIAQDIFEVGVVPADTDYRMFSAKHLGHMPGIDLALLLDAASYHTNRDTAERLRPGSIQEFGDTVVGLIPEFSKQLAARLNATTTTADDVSGGDARDVARREQHAVLESDGVYYDVFGFFMITYSKRVASVLHVLPLIACLIAPLLLQSHVCSGYGSAMAGMLHSAAWHVMCCINMIALSTIIGIARAWLSGKPMVWFTAHAAAYSMYVPAAMAGACMTPPPQHVQLPVLLLGGSLLTACCAAALAAVQAGSAFLFAAFAGFTIIAALFVSQRSDAEHWTGLSAALCVLWPPCQMAAVVAGCLVTHVLEKISMSGSLPPPFAIVTADMVVGVVIGVACALCMLALLPYIHLGLAGGRRLGIVSLLLACSITASLYWTATQQPYSDSMPKRALVQHVHSVTHAHDAAAPRVASSKWVVASMDATPVDGVLPRDTSLQLHSIAPTPRDFQSFAPITHLLRGKAFEAAVTDTDNLVSPPPVLQLLRVDDDCGARCAAQQHGSAQQKRVHMKVVSSKPFLGVLKIDAALSAWSFSATLYPPADAQGASMQRIARLSNNDWNATDWEFWLDAPVGAAVHVELDVAYLEMTAAMARFTASMPSWTSVVSGSVYQSTLDVHVE